MTVENTIARYKRCLVRLQDPTLEPARYVPDKIGTQKPANPKASLLAEAEDLKKHMLKSKKFKGHPFLAELTGKPNKVEAQPDGKKPKR